MDQKQKLFIGPHIPKCAGINFTEAIRRQIGTKHCICDSFLKRFYLEDERFPEERESLDHIRVIFGHATDQFTIRHALEREIILFTFIRHPINRIISFYTFTFRHRKERGLPLMDFDTFYNELQHNSMCKWLTERFHYFAGQPENSLSTRAASVLKSFRFVCATEDLNERGDNIYNALKIEYDSSNRYNCSPKHNINELRNTSDIDKLLEDNSEDMILYQKYISGRESDKQNPFVYDHDHFQKSIALLSIDQTPTHDIWRSRYKYLADNLHLNNLIDSAKKSAQNRLQQAEIFSEVLNTKGNDPSEFKMKQHFPQDERRNYT